MVAADLSYLDNDKKGELLPGVAYLDDKILVCGGNNISRTCWNYDPMADSWSVYSTGGSLPDKF